jgi:hypothetical protein
MQQTQKASPDFDNNQTQLITPKNTAALTFQIRKLHVSDDAKEAARRPNALKIPNTVTWLLFYLLQSSTASLKGKEHGIAVPQNSGASIQSSPSRRLSSVT